MRSDPELDLRVVFEELADQTPELPFDAAQIQRQPVRRQWLIGTPIVALVLAGAGGVLHYSIVNNTPAQLTFGGEDDYAIQLRAAGGWKKVAGPNAVGDTAHQADPGTTLGGWSRRVPASLLPGSYRLTRYFEASGPKPNYDPLQTRGSEAFVSAQFTVIR